MGDYSTAMTTSCTVPAGSTGGAGLWQWVVSTEDGNTHAFTRHTVCRTCALQCLASLPTLSLRQCRLFRMQARLERCYLNEQASMRVYVDYSKLLNECIRLYGEYSFTLSIEAQKKKKKKKKK